MTWLKEPISIYALSAFFCFCFALQHADKFDKAKFGIEEDVVEFVGELVHKLLENQVLKSVK
jgi:hypothetical protein